MKSIKTTVMSRANRAAQFTPFDSLKGLQEALREKEEQLSRVQKHGISEEERAEITSTLATIKKRMNVEVVHYCLGHYITCRGQVTDINYPFKYLKVNQTTISFNDITKLTL